MVLIPYDYITYDTLFSSLRVLLSLRVTTGNWDYLFYIYLGWSNTDLVTLWSNFEKRNCLYKLQNYVQRADLLFITDYH